jgi:hypothetical protein
VRLWLVFQAIRKVQIGIVSSRLRRICEIVRESRSRVLLLVCYGKESVLRSGAVGCSWWVVVGAGVGTRDE